MTEEKVSWFKRVFEDYYIVTVYYKNSNKTRTFELKEIKKINNKQIKGKNKYGEEIDYCTSEPFDYYVEKIY